MVKRFLFFSCLSLAFFLLPLFINQPIAADVTESNCVITKVGNPNGAPALPPGCDAPVAGGGAVNCGKKPYICAFEFMVGPNDYCCKWGDGRGHEGVDLIVKEGTPIRALEDGTVVYSVNDDTCGWSVKVKYTNQRYALHCHMLEKGLDKNRTFKRGDVLGKVSNTGSLGGSAKHLHYQISTVGNAKGWANPEIVLANWPNY